MSLEATAVKASGAVYIFSGGSDYANTANALASNTKVGNRMDLSVAGIVSAGQYAIVITNIASPATSIKEFSVDINIEC